MSFMCDLSEVEGARRGTAPRFRFAQPGVSNVLPLRGRFLILYYGKLKYIIPELKMFFVAIVLHLVLFVLH